MEIFDAVVIGTGQGGLAASYVLKDNGLSHIVFERGEVGFFACGSVSRIRSYFSFE
jgi:cation diffusion facilitator CzcD-associated flavoprotein CzcO